MTSMFRFAPSPSSLLPTSPDSSHAASVRFVDRSENLVPRISSACSSPSDSAACPRRCSSEITSSLTPTRPTLFRCDSSAEAGTVLLGEGPSERKSAREPRPVER